jgi:hypothetical protein
MEGQRPANGCHIAPKVSAGKCFFFVFLETLNSNMYW